MGGGRTEVGMPLGNLTSQFFANVYLSELDYYIKHQLKAEFYIRYVDDSVILNDKREVLENHKEKIDYFLKKELHLELHPDKSKIIPFNRGINFLGFKIFYYHKLLKKSNSEAMKINLVNFKAQFLERKTDYDKIYSRLEGWFAYTKNGNCYKLSRDIIKQFEAFFPNQISSLEIDRWTKS